MVGRMFYMVDPAETSYPDLSSLPAAGYIQQVSADSAVESRERKKEKEYIYIYKERERWEMLYIKGL